MYKTLGGLKNHIKSHGGEEPSSIYFCGECEKSLKTQGGLMHHKCKHVLISDKDFEEKMCDLIENTKKGNFSCYPDDIKSAIINYHDHSTPLFLADTKIIVEAFMNRNDADTFYASYFSKIVINANFYFQLSGPECTLFAKTLGDKILCNFSKTNSGEPVESFKPISEREMGGLQYLAGYVLRKLKSAAQKNKNRTAGDAELSILQRQFQLAMAIKH